MCARYTVTTTDASDFAQEFDVKVLPPGLEPHYNLAPTQEAPIVVASREGERQIVLARFGLVPHWAHDVKVGTRFLNARSESVADTPAYRDAFSRHRCLVAADGFFEWQKEGKLKIPHYFHLPDRNLFAFAGLWAAWRDPKGGRVLSFSILTRAAEGAAGAFHDRMPVILERDVYAAFLDRGTTDADAVVPLIHRHRAAELVSDRVSRRVNDVKNDDPSLLDPDGA
jgi:putative SOS response-associated peptidase YedK